MVGHAKKAEKFIADTEKVDWHDDTLWYVREKRDVASNTVPEWETLRTLASDIKSHTLSRLDHYLIEFEAQAKANGIIVHWAKDGLEHNKIVHQILQKHKIDKVVKSKSMLTEECGLNEYLEHREIEVIDTDLGERIIQLRKEPPSHIVLPAIHLKKEEVGELFQEKLGTEPNNNDPNYLTYQARLHLREKFLKAEAAITGVNFGIAETGEVIVCTNEGNADMGVHLAPIQIHCMGIEKLIAKREHLGVFTRLLARSATGQPITIYTSHHQRAKEGGEMHIVLVDNGRSDRLAKDKFWSSLKCIRCGACMNTCPIYRRSGGYSYDYTIPGPIGSILSPSVDMEKYSDLPFASTLCGSCSDVCPVQINIHEQLYDWRQEIGAAGHLGKTKSFVFKMTDKILSDPEKFNRLSKLMRWSLKYLPSFMLNNKLNAWSIGRKLPEPPKETFKEWYQKNELK